MKKRLRILKQNGDLTLFGIAVVPIFVIILSLFLDVSASFMRAMYM